MSTSLLTWSYTTASTQPKDGFVIETQLGVGGGHEEVRNCDEQRANDIAGSLNELGRWATGNYRFDDPGVQEELQRLYALLKGPSRSSDGEFVSGSQKAVLS